MVLGSNTLSATAGDSPCSGTLSTYILQAPPVPTSITLYSSYPNPGYITNPYFIVGGVAYGLTAKIFKDASCTLLVGSSAAYSTTVLITDISGLIVGTNNLYAQTSNSVGSSACSGILLAYVVSSPLQPTSLTLNGSSPSPGYSTSPSVSVAGVANGLTAQVFSDAACTTLIGSSTASGTSAWVGVSNLPLGTTNLYANTKNDLNQTSACSTSTVSYTVLSPTVNSVTLTFPSTTTAPSTVIDLMTTTTPASQTVNFYQDSACATTTLGSGFSSPTYPIGLKSLTSGSHRFYAKILAGSFNVASACVDTGIVYVVAPKLTMAAAALTTTSSSIGKVAFADFNGDGYIDIVVPQTGSSASTPLNLYLGNGNGTLQAPINLGNTQEPQT
jgi:hypothetical protein